MPVLALGSEQVGVVLSKRGKVTARNADQGMRILKRADPIYADDQVCTVRGANAQIKMRDQNVVMLRGGCAFRVSLYSPRVAGLGQRYEYVGGVLRESRDHNPIGGGLNG